MAGTAMGMPTMSKLRYKHKNAVLKVGLIGCGGRGTGAAAQAMMADDQVELFAMGDAFADRLEQSYAALKEELPQKVTVTAQHKYVGFDAYQKVIDSGVDVVILTTPPVFRPLHLTAAIEAGKHVFCEKPMAIDGVGVRKVLAAAKAAKAKDLSIVCGFTYRFGNANRAIYQQIHEGAIGEIKAVSTTRYGGELWSKPRQSDWSDMEYCLRNWLYYDWLSGDFICEQAVHSLDLMAWALKDQLPIKAIGSGGRQKRTAPIFGNIYDHFAIEFEYPNEVKGYHFTRQQAECQGKNTVDVIGTEGIAALRMGRSWEIKGHHPWQYHGEHNDMYQTQHNELFQAIRSGNPINQGEWMAHSSMLAVLGRMVAYSGQEISWDDAIHSEIALGPPLEEYRMDLALPASEVAIPGKTKVL